jgi:hypothetical protein
MDYIKEYINRGSFLNGYDKEGTNENTKTNSRGVCFC